MGKHSVSLKCAKLSDKPQHKGNPVDSQESPLKYAEEPGF